ncbi:MAG TPA: tRNA lysidine(34) synthetase TilS [bacterium]|nr:tRNA lysidine(34) synthetase TilS [bacterium]
MESILRLPQAPFSPKDRLIVAVSGGSDSVGLLFLLLRDLPDASERLRVAHVNYGLRGKASLADEKKVRDLCSDLGIPFRCFRIRGFEGMVRKEKRSPQDLARTIRYAFFQDLARRERAWGVAVAHHWEDQVETLLDRLLRGAGPKGLSGLRPLQTLGLTARGRPLRVWRPLLGFPKARIQGFLKSNGIPWREDRSNRKDAYRRNQIRHQIIPFLSRWNPGFSRNLVRLAEVLQAENEFIEGLLPFLDKKLRSRRRGKDHECSSSAFLRMPLALQRRWVRRVAEGFTPLARGFSFERVEAVLRVWKGEEKGPRDLGFGLSADRRGQKLVLAYQRLPSKVSRR